MNTEMRSLRFTEERALRRSLFFGSSFLAEIKTTPGGSFKIYFLVRMKGLEPSRLSALVPKTSVSTNSTTSACSNAGTLLGIIANYPFPLKR